MVYQNKFVACVKVGGQILRETNNHTVALPFGAEYSLLFKNLNSRRVKVRVSIDGADVLSGTSLVINPNSHLELERFIRADNMNEGNRFKFIERTSEVEAHRGVKADDGIVRIEYSTERQVVQAPYVEPEPWTWPYPSYPPRNPWYPRPRWGNSHKSGRIQASAGSRSRSMSIGGSGSRISLDAAFENYSGASGANENVNNVGITAAGSLSQQSFVSVADFQTESTDVVTLRLVGRIKGAAIEKAVTVTTKAACSSCGKTAKAGAEFCSQCGTALSLV